MSKKTSKLDLLVRVRYANPLPAPPCPPKLLDIPTNPMRYARPDFLNSIASETPLPMIVDAEMGMPLDLGKWECLWEEDADDSALNPDLNNLPKLDPKDQALVDDDFSSSSFRSAPSAPLANVTWLRRTEYIGRDTSQRSVLQETKHIMAQNIDISREAQLRDIEASFAACNDDFSLEMLRHPNKKDVTAVESYEVLPDSHIWANQYDLFRFAERPGERALDVEDPRLDCAILRPMKSEYDSFLAYYLTQDDDSAFDLKNARKELAAYDVPEQGEETVFRFVRDYETTKVEQDVPNEFVLVIDDGDSPEDVFSEDFNQSKKAHRLKGAYYKNIERKMYLKKKRANIHEHYEDKWELIRMTHVPMSKEEEEEREEALAEVNDPMYMFAREDADADGDVEVEDAGQANGGLDFST